jgi:SAM-dependent methyltransferase
MQSTQLEELTVLQDVVDQHLRDRNHRRVLEAGCGSVSHFVHDAYVVGIDTSAVQLGRNGSLDERILGDVQSHELPGEAFDLIVCWNVLEHLPHPERALARFYQAVKPGGLIVLSFPHPLSVKGLVTKFTPFRFHVWARRHLAGRQHAGRDGRGPFPTFLRFSIRPDRVLAGARGMGLQPIHFRLFEANQQKRIRRRLGIVGGRWRFIQRLVHAVSLGHVETVRCQCILALQKVGPEAGTRT